jgi:hypothetical protein
MQISPDLISAGVSFVITIFILSYLLGDNILFRLAIYVFVGATAGYVAAVASTEVLYPALLQPFFSRAAFTDVALAIRIGVPLLGSILLLFKVFPRVTHLGQLPMAYLVGVGAAVTIGGAVLGTLLPQISATVDNFDVDLAVARNIDPIVMLGQGILILICVTGTLVYFHFGATQSVDGSVRRNPIVNILAWIGRVFIAITFGVLFAGVYMAALTALIERMDSIRSFFLQMMQ